ncbi:MAG: hypothetical protein QXF20_05455 [Candidatus Hadarchaeales archaeon]
MKALEPISKFGGNIRNVVHKREKKTKLGLVPVTVILEISDRGRFRRMLSELKAKGIRITHVGEREELRKRIVLIGGKMTVEDLREITERMEGTGAKVSDMRLSMGEKEMAVRLSLNGRDEKVLEEALSLLERISEERGLLFLKALEEKA